ncbi:MAG TPA: hypothetical protein VNC39_01690 [Acidocella sp.]|jgi:hypothetical protein|uniref:hypothetical protein n=1 Tax=Acidocella sp. TaxID=50710 RepID=UPI002CBD2AF7|nr:hypothetical protein [Acidocella sp.]HVE20663.1 hypothetical protein [Acidocella sp.]
MDAIIAPNTVPLSEADGPPATGTPQYAVNGVPGSTVPTQFPAYHYNGIVQEILALQGGAGLTNNRQALNQVLQAVKRFAGGNVTTVTASATLTADNAGLVLVNAADSNITITMPAAASANGIPLSFKIIRTDTSANTVTYALAENDTILPTGSTGGSIGNGLGADLIGDGISHWWQPGSGRLISVETFNASGVYNAPPGTKFVIVNAKGGGSAGGGAPACSTGATSIGSGGTEGTYASGIYAEGFNGVAVTVGAGGTPVAGGTGSPGGASSFGALLTAPGGPAAQIAGPSSASFTTGGINGTLASGANLLNIAGAPGGVSLSFGGSNLVSSSGGGSGAGAAISAGQNGFSASSNGAGGGGTAQISGGPALTGGRGGNGYVQIYAFA